MTRKDYQDWEKDQIIGFSLVPVVFIMCMYHTELSNILGNILHYFLDF